MNQKLKHLLGGIRVAAVAFACFAGFIFAILAYVFHSKTSDCSNDAVVNIHDWLLGFAVATTIFVVYVILLSLYDTQLDLGFILHIFLFGIFGIFFVIWHFLAYDALFSHGINCKGNSIKREFC